ncbi:hypothetical protein LINGRAHAP2_LOCUS9267 [Linum grandiflorum]
MILELL